ncbi:MAG: hypothetical protein M3R12_02615 [Actinomycetota bacterium]|nr:hypothetical protein [Actinomycetota bacterium]
MADESEGCILVVANRTCPCPDVLDAVCRRAKANDGDIVIVAPALNSRLRHYVSDIDGAVAEAEERLAVAIGGLAERGVEATGEVGDADPLQAIEDAFRRFTPVEIVVSTYSQERSKLARAQRRRPGERALRRHCYAYRQPLRTGRGCVTT